MNETGAWMPMFWSDYFGDTMHLSTEEHGAYLILIGVYWLRGKALPDDDRWLASTAKMSTKKWKMVRPKIAELFEITDGVWLHKRVEKEILRSSGRLKSARVAGKAGGLAKSYLSTTTTTKKKERYAFEGKIVRLTQADFDRWKSRFHAIPDLEAMLASQDDYYASLDPPPDNWFIRLSRHLENQHQKFLAKNGEAEPAETAWSHSEQMAWMEENRPDLAQRRRELKGLDEPRRDVTPTGDDLTPPASLDRRDKPKAAGQA